MSEDNILKKSLEKAFKGGIAGSTAMVLQVGSLMWLRTTMNYQYRYGTTFNGTLSKLYKEGGVRRFYRGVGPALFMGPLSRFGDTAANVGVLTYLEKNEKTKELNIGIKTTIASGFASLWRINLMPIDTLKTILQIEGKNALPLLSKKIKLGGPSVLYHGSFGAFSATYSGHFPWYFTFNYLNAKIPKYENNMFKKLSRNALIGFSASLVSDTISNSIRVIKISKQSYYKPISYFAVTNKIIERDGVLGLMGRGLKTRILCNGLQGMMFSVLWILLMDNF
jgi:hypothetical protein